MCEHDKKMILVGSLSVLSNMSSSLFLIVSSVSSELMLINPSSRIISAHRMPGNFIFPIKTTLYDFSNNFFFFFICCLMSFLEAAPCIGEKCVLGCEVAFDDLNTEVICWANPLVLGLLPMISLACPILSKYYHSKIKKIKLKQLAIIMTKF